MPVDRNLLPPLPGKPAWYVENAPQAVDPLTVSKPADEYELLERAAAVRAMLRTSKPSSVPAQSETRLVPAGSVFPTSHDSHDGHDGHARAKGLKKVKSLTGKLRG